MENIKQWVMNMVSASCVLKITFDIDYCHHFQNNIIIIFLIMTEKKNQLNDGNTQW